MPESDSETKRWQTIHDRCLEKAVEMVSGQDKGEAGMKDLRELVTIAAIAKDKLMLMERVNA